MADKKRPPLTDLTSGTSALSRHVVNKGETVHDAPAREAAQAGAGDTEKKPPRFMQTRLTESDWDVLRDFAHKRKKPLQQFTIEAWNDLLRKYGEAPVIEGPTPAKKGK